MKSQRSLPLVILSYLMVYIIWGSTYLFIAYAVESIPAPWVLATRFLASGIAFILVPVLGGRVKRFPSGKEILSACFLGLFLLILGNGILTWAEKTVDSHIAALMISTVPLVAALYNAFLYKERLNAWKLCGMAVGTAGVALLLFRGAGRGVSITAGSILVVIALFSWAFGTSYARKLKPHGDVFLHTGMQMLFAGLASWAMAALMTGRAWPALEGTTPLSWISVAYLAFVGGSGIIAYNYLLIHEPTSRVTTYAFVNPLIATFLGLFVRKEAFSPLLVPGMALILAGLTMILYLGKTKAPAAAGATPLAASLQDPVDK